MTVRRRAVACAAVGLAAMLTAGLVAVRSQVVSGRAVAGAPAAAGTLPRSAPSAPPVVTPPARDARLRLPRLHVDAPIVSVGLTGRVMQVPRNPSRVGWWRDGAVPGAAHGSAVLVGHVNYGGTSGAFAALPRTRPGDRIVLTRPEVRFRVAAVRTYPKTSGIPARAFAAGGPAQLVLVTCGGDFDRRTGNYRDNVVVYAVRV